MRLSKEMSHYDRQTRRGWMYWPLGLIIAGIIGSLTIDALAIDDVNTDAGAAHVGPVPEGVTYLSADAYLVKRGSSSTANEICRGGNTSDDNAKETKQILSLDQTYVECVVDQKWNLPKTKANPNFIQGLDQASKKRGWQLFSAIALPLALIFPIIVWLNDGIGALKERRKQKHQRQITYNKQLAQYRALQSSWSKDEINDLQFDQKLQKLVEEGFVVPDSGVFSKNHGR